MRYLQMLICWPLILIFTPVLYLTTYLPEFITRNYYQYLTQTWCRLFVRALGVKLQLIHENKKPPPNHFILIANHPSSLEDFGLPACFKISPLAKEGVRHWFFLGRIAERAGAIFFNRDDSSARHAAKETMIKALKNGKNIVLFPEGGCMGKNIYKTFKTGAFDASIQTGLPIIPVYLQYEDREAFEWLDPDTLLDNMWQIMTASNNRANYYIKDAIYPNDFTDKVAYAEHVHSLYIEWQENIFIAEVAKNA